jgi:mono/diheme cytochrome c family protein
LSARLISAAWLAAAPAALAAPDGAASFADHCVVCHQADAQGATGLAPSLAGTLAPYASTAQGRQYLSQILISGMAGRIESQGQTLIGNMPAFATTLDDATIAATINYVLATYNGVAAAPITPASVAAARAAAPSAADTRHLRAAILAGSK